MQNGRFDVVVAGAEGRMAFENVGAAVTFRVPPVRRRSGVAVGGIGALHGTYTA
jgi:hypothetical protein